MGDIADSMLDGTMCAECGVYVGVDWGVPVICNSCFDDDHKTAKSNGYTRLGKESGE